MKHRKEYSEKEAKDKRLHIGVIVGGVFKSSGSFSFRVAERKNESNISVGQN